MQPIIIIIIISVLSQRMMMLVFLSLTLGLRIVAGEPLRTVFSLPLSSSHVPVPFLVFVLLFGVRLSESIQLFIAIPPVYFFKLPVVNHDQFFVSALLLLLLLSMPHSVLIISFFWFFDVVCYFLPVMQFLLG